MTNLKKAVTYITSKSYVDFVIKNNTWCEHGSNLFDYFEDQGLEYEFANSKEKRKIVESYIKQRLSLILIELKYENPHTLYRAIFSKKKPN